MVRRVPSPTSLLPLHESGGAVMGSRLIGRETSRTEPQHIHTREGACECLFGTKQTVGTSFHPIPELNSWLLGIT